MGYHASGVERVKGCFACALHPFITLSRLVQHAPPINPYLVSFLLLQQDCVPLVPLHVVYERFAYLGYWAGCVSCGCERVGLRTALFSLFQRIVAQVHSAGRRFAGGCLYLWKYDMEHLPVHRVDRCYHLLGGASLWRYHWLPPCYYLSRSGATKTTSLLGRGNG